MAALPPLPPEAVKNVVHAAAHYEDLPDNLRDRFHFVEQFSVEGVCAKEAFENLADKMMAAEKRGENVQELLFQETRQQVKDIIPKELRGKVKVQAQLFNLNKAAKTHKLTPRNWLVDAFGPIVQASEPKRHLFKLLEFNKIEVLRS